jgi:hypothetical protein
MREMESDDGAILLASSIRRTAYDVIGGRPCGNSRSCVHNVIVIIFQPVAMRCLHFVEFLLHVTNKKQRAQAQTLTSGLHPVPANDGRKKSMEP